MSEISEFESAALPPYEKARLQTAAHKHIRDVVNRSLKPFSINTTQWMILGVLIQNKANKTSEIARCLEVEVPLITTLVQPLLASGFIDQFADKRDKRSKPLKITQAGEEMLEKIDDKLKDDLQKLEDNISSEQMDQYFVTLKAIISNGIKHSRH